MKNSNIILTIASLFLITFLQNSNAQQSSFEISRIERKTIKSTILGEDRKIQIYTPSNVNKSDKLPVLYLLDGEAQMSLVVGQVQYLTESYKVLPSMIIVAIENTDRIRDLTPTHSLAGPDGKIDSSKNAFGRNSGGGEKFISFIRQELMPYIETNYQTVPYKILVGHSLGGLLALHSFLYHPEYFNAYIAISPSLQWDNAALLKDAGNRLALAKHNSRLFLSDGSEGGEFHLNVLKLDSTIKRVNNPGVKSKYVYYPEEAHTVLPVKAFYDGIRFIYPEWHLPYNNAFRKTLSAKVIKDHFSKLSATYNYKVVPLHDDVNALSRFLRNDSLRIKEAIELLEMNAQNYPHSPAVFEHLGDTFLRMDKKDEAIANFEKALALHPENEKLKGKIKNLKR